MLDSEVQITGLQIEAVVGGCHSNVNARIPIVMGTIPLLTGPTAYKPSAATVGPVSPPFNPVPPPAEPNGQPAPPAPGGGWSVPSISGSGDGTSLSPAGFVPTAPPLYPELRKYLLSQWTNMVIYITV